MLSEGLERLRVLANHLNSEEPLYVGTFNFRVIGAKGSGKECGCAMGETTYMWEGWEDCKGWDYPHYEGFHTVGTSFQAFFGITEKEEEHLFHPFRQNVKKYGGKNLNDWSYREEVGSNMPAFLAIKEKENENA